MNEKTRTGAWKPIETAQKDGENILVLVDSCHPAIAYFRNHFMPELEGWYSSNGIARFKNVTHWMHIPRPTKKNNKGESYYE